MRTSPRLRLGWSLTIFALAVPLAAQNHEAPPPNLPPGQEAPHWAVQVAAFADREGAAEESERLQKAGFPVLTDEFTPRVGRALTLLLVGPYPDWQAAEAVAAKLQGLGWPGYVRRYTASASAVARAVAPTRVPPAETRVEMAPRPAPTPGAPPEPAPSEPVAAERLAASKPAPSGAAEEGQAAPPAPEPPAETAVPFRPPEGSVIINLPSADSIPKGSLHFLVTHRFSEHEQGSTFHSFFGFFSGADVGLGASYAPVRGLEAGFVRGNSLEDWEVFAKYSVLSSPDNPLHAAVRIGGNIKGQKNFEDPASFFAQGVLALTIASRVRLTAVPTFSTQAVGQQDILPGHPRRKNVFNVPAALSIAITRSINLQGEVVPRREGSPGVGWIGAIEKTVLRHRFSFTVGNMRATTVDQYVAPDFGFSPTNNIYFGFNIVRLWKLN
jgi:hypothetical protein